MTKHKLNATNGRKGGYSTLQKYGTEHYRRMALIALEKYGRERMRLIGKLGGERYNQRYVAGGVRGSIHPDDELPL